MLALPGEPVHLTSALAMRIWACRAGLGLLKLVEDSAPTGNNELGSDALDRLGRTRIRPELARVHLLHGE